MGFSSPTAIVFDNLGNMFVGDAGSKVVYKIALGGTGTIYAGHIGSATISGDGGPATFAGLGSVSGLSLDAAGSLYIADGNARIRVVSPAGIINTFAGSGSLGYSGNGGPASAATFDGISAVAVDAAGNVYVSENNNKHGTQDKYSRNREQSSRYLWAIRVTGNGGPATAARLNGPAALAINPDGDLVICDQGNNRVRKIYGCPSGVTTSPSSTAVHPGDVAHFFAGTTSLFATYQWQGNSGAGFVNVPNILPYLGVTTNSLTILNATTTLNGTTYRCIISRSDLCKDTTSAASLIVTVDGSGTGGGGTDTTNSSVSVTCLSTPKGVSIYPNPAHDYVDVTIEGSIPATLQLYNQLGQVVETQQATGYAKIYLHDLATGFYMLRVVVGGNNSVYKLYKN